MMKYSLEEFRNAQKHFPNLYVDGRKIKGELNFCAHYKDVGCDGISEWIIEPCDQSEDDCIEDVYSIEINLEKQDQINGFPVVFETDGRIKERARFLGKILNDLHLNSDGSCCLGIFASSDRLSICDLIIKMVYPYFVWQTYYEKYKKSPPCGELPHDWKKALSMRIKDTKESIKSWRTKQKGKPNGGNRNQPCPCGMGGKYKKCHFNSDKEIDTKIKAQENLLLYLERKDNETTTYTKNNK